MLKSVIVYYTERIYSSNRMVLLSENCEILTVIQNVPQDMSSQTVLKWYAKKYAFEEESLHVVVVDSVEYVA